MTDFYEQDGFGVDRIDIPIGRTFDPYYDWNSGLGVGLSIGPTAFIVVGEEVHGYDKVFLCGAGRRLRPLHPLPGSYSLALQPRRSQVPDCWGDNLESSQVGIFGAVGVEFWRTKKVGMSIEVGYDASEIKIKYTTQGGANLSSNVTFGGFTAGLSIAF